MSVNQKKPTKEELLAIYEKDKLRKEKNRVIQDRFQAAKKIKQLDRKELEERIVLLENRLLKLEESVGILDGDLTAVEETINHIR